MNIGVIFGQMLVLLAMMAVGYLCYVKKWITEESSGHFSKLVVNVFNPVLVVNGVLGHKSSEAGSNIGFNIAFIIGYFVILLLIGFVMPYIVRADAVHKNVYRLMTIFGNIGFMGIPVIRSIFGNESMIYVAFYILGYNIMLYTCGMYLAKKAGEDNRNRPFSYLEAVAANGEAGTKKIHGSTTADKGETGGAERKGFLGQMMNPGVMAAILAVIIFAAGIKLPEPVCTFCDYMGNTTIPVSMLLIGVSIAQVNLREVFGEWRIYIFVLIRMIILPMIMIFALKGVVTACAISPVVFGVFIIELGMPVGSMIALMTREQGGDIAYCTKGVVLSTLASIVTIPIICAFL